MSAISDDIIKVIDECNIIIKKYWDILSGVSHDSSDTTNQTVNKITEADLLGDSYNG